MGRWVVVACWTSLLVACGRIGYELQHNDTQNADTTPGTVGADGVSSGGTANSAGGTNGGDTGTAGLANTGGSAGATASGGAANTGGSAGATASGGAANTGGSAGATASGGAAGAANTGGSAGATASGGTAGLANTGGSAGATASGGAANTGGAAAGGASSGGGAGTGSGTTGDFVVTTSVDEADPGATVQNPGGTGLSLREALLLANAAGGTQSISFQSGVVVAITSGALPTITAAVHLIGNGGAIDGAALATNECLLVAGANVVIENLEIFNCTQEAIFGEATATNLVVKGCYIHDNAKEVRVEGTGSVVGPFNRIERSANHGVGVYGPSIQVRDNEIFDVAAKSVYLAKVADDATIVGNLIVRSGNGAIGFNNSVGAKVWFNTIHATTGTGVTINQSSGIDLRNNIITDSTSNAISGQAKNFVALDFNLVFGNGSPCSGCTLGPNCVLLDPSYASAATDDYSLASTSPAIDAGLDVGEDRNGSAPGLFNGLAPDMGYLETP